MSFITMRVFQLSAIILENVSNKMEMLFTYNLVCESVCSIRQNKSPIYSLPQLGELYNGQLTSLGRVIIMNHRSQVCCFVRVQMTNKRVQT